MDSAAKPQDFRYRVLFTPVGWQVVDTAEARDPLAEFGTGQDEYARASRECVQRNIRHLRDALAYESLTESRRFQYQAMLAALKADRV